MLAVTLTDTLTPLAQYRSEAAGFGEAGKWLLGERLFSFS
jgi:hypothetical protein